VTRAGSKPASTRAARLGIGRAGGRSPRSVARPRPASTSDPASRRTIFQRKWEARIWSCQQMVPTAQLGPDLRLHAVVTGLRAADRAALKKAEKSSRTGGLRCRGSPSISVSRLVADPPGRDFLSKAVSPERDPVDVAPEQRVVPGVERGELPPPLWAG
jgi:hypothetical protein